MLRIAEMTPALIHRLRVLTLEVFKSLQKSNPPCLHDLFEINKTDYLMRNSMRLIQPKRRTTNYGIRTVSYIGANTWNQWPFIGHDTLHMSASEFKQLLNAWNWPDLNSAICKYVWIHLSSSMVISYLFSNPIGLTANYFIRSTIGLA